jgi:hypothetical protein
MFNPENELEEALVLAESGGDAQAQFECLLLASRIHVIGENEGVNPAEHSVKVPEGANMRLAMIQRGTVRYVPLFTSVARLQFFFDYAGKSLQIKRYLSMSGRALFESTKDQLFVINPGFPHMREFSPAEITRLLAIN